jgi:hypothetical protein
VSIYGAWRTRRARRRRGKVAGEGSSACGWGVAGGYGGAAAFRREEEAAWTRSSVEALRGGGTPTGPLGLVEDGREEAGDEKRSSAARRDVVTVRVRARGRGEGRSAEERARAVGGGAR